MSCNPVHYASIPASSVHVQETGRLLESKIKMPPERIEKMRQAFAALSEQTNITKALEEMYNTHPVLFRRWIEEEAKNGKEWLLKNDIGTVTDKKDKIVAVYDVDADIPDFIPIREYKGRICTGCAVLYEKDDVKDMEQFDIEYHGPYDDGVEFQKRINSAAQTYRGVYFCEDCRDLYYDK